MNRRQFFALLICSLVPWWVGSAFMPLLPIYAAGLGASAAMVGNYLSFIFLSLAAGTVFAGWISVKVPRLRSLMTAAALLAMVSTYLMGQVTTIWQLFLWNGLSWLAAGIIVSLISILAGRSAVGHERGKVFGLLAMTTALGGVLGGPAGLVVDRWGYPLLFAIAASLYLVEILAVAFLPAREEIPAVDAQPAQAEPPLRLGYAYWILLVAVLTFGVSTFVAGLGRTLAMDVQGFSATSISMIVALGSVVAIVVNPLVGHLADRMNRRLLLALVYAVGALALLLLSIAASWSGFAVVSVLVALGSAERAVSSALVVDMAPTGAINRSLSIFEAIKWLGGVVGFAVTGYAVDALGLKTAIVTSVSLPVIAMLLLGVGHRLQSGSGWPTWKWRIGRSAGRAQDEAVRAAQASNAAR